jgi:hypothetical protein
MRKTRKLTKRKRKPSTRKNYRGGIKIRLPGSPKNTPTTKETNLKIQAELGHIKIKHYESVILEEINKLSNLRANCIESCRLKVAAIGKAEDAQERLEQFNVMMETKAEGEWGNLCNNQGVPECKSYLSAIQRVELYIKTMSEMAKFSQDLLSNYKATNFKNEKIPSQISVIPKPTFPLRPVIPPTAQPSSNPLSISTKGLTPTSSLESMESYGPTSPSSSKSFLSF